MPLHSWMDASKEFIADFRHRALRHHAQGIFECERVFGVTLTTSDGRQVPTRLVGEQHVREDCGRIPTLADWLRTIKGEAWMYKVIQKGAGELAEPDSRGMYKSVGVSNANLDPAGDRPVTD